MLDTLRSRISTGVNARIMRAADYMSERLMAAKKSSTTEQIPLNRLNQEAFSVDAGDYVASAYSSGLNPSTWGAVVREAEGGDLSRYMDILLDIERRDGHLRGVLSSRRNAVAGKPYYLEPNPLDKGEKIAIAVQEMLDKLSLAKPLNPGETHLTFSDVLHDMASGVYLGLSAHEIIWDVSSGQGVVDELRWVHPRRFVVNTTDEKRPIGQLLLRKTSDDTEGEVLWPAKWVIHRPRIQSDWSWRQGLGFPIGWIFCFKAYAVRDWAALSELTGVPMRIAKYPNGSQKELINQLKAAVASIGVDFYAVVPEGTELEFVQAQHGGDEEFHKVYATWCDMQISKAVLGHTGSADSTAGKLGNEDMATQVRQDLINGDAVMLQSTIERDLIAPFVGINFGWDAPMPRFVIDVSPPVDLESRSLIDERLAKIGWAFKASHFENMYSVEGRETGEDIIEPLVKLETPETVHDQQKKGDERPENKKDDTPVKEEKKPVKKEEEASASPFIAADPAIARADEHLDHGDELIAKSVARSHKAWRPFLSGVKDVIRSSKNYTQALGLLDASDYDLDSIEKLMAESQYSGYVVGRAQIADETNTLLEPIKASAARSDSVVESTDPLAPWDEKEALEWLRDRAKVPYSDFKDSVAAIKARTFAMKGIEEKYVLDGVRSEIERSLEQGTPYKEFSSGYDKMMSKLGVTPTNSFHLETIFENAIANSIAVSRYDGMRDPDVIAGRPYWEYVTAGDSQVRDEHAQLEGLVYPADHPFWGTYYPPNGHRCVTGDTDVQGRFELALKSRYTGKMVKVTTANGNVLTVTPNHPIATFGGNFVAAGELRKGMDLIRYKSGVKSMLGVRDEQNTPATAEQVFSSFDKIGAGVELDTIPEDLHGDAVFGDGKINIVSADGKLLLNVETGSDKSIEDGLLGVSSMTDDILSSYGDSTSAGIVDSLSSCCTPSSRALALDSRPVVFHDGPFDLLLVGSGAELDATRFQQVRDCPPGNCVLRREEENRLPADVKTNSFLDVDAVSSRTNSHLDASVFQDSVNVPSSSAGDSKCIADLRDSFPGKVLKDEIVSVELVDFDGHVFDLQSPFGYYIADGLIISNCRCQVITRSESEVKANSSMVQGTVPPMDAKGTVHKIEQPPAGWDINPGFIPEEV